ncbi:MAG: CPBP family intramembrane metalloprotease, partial [Candidatus Omnitrophota bacterium]
ADGSTKALKIEDEIDSWVQLPDRVTFSPSKDPLVNFFNTANRRKFSRLFSSLKRGRGAFRHLQNTIIQERRTAGTFKDEDDIKKRLDVSARMLRGLRHILSERFGEQYEFTDLLRPREDREREAEEPAVPPGQEEKQESAVMKPAPVLFAGEDIADENYEKGHVRKYGGPVSYDSGARRWADSDPGYARMIEDEGIEEFSRELSRAGLGCLLENNIGYMRIKVENTLSGKTIDPASQIAGLSADPARCRLLSKILLPDIKDDILNEEYERYAEELLQTLGVKLDRDTLQERISYLKEMFKQKLGCQAGGAIASALFRKGTRGDLLASELVGRAVDVFEKQQARLGNEEKIRKIKKESPLEYAEGYVHALFQYFALYLRPGSGIGPEKLNEEERAFFGDVVAFLRGERKRYGDAFFLSREDALTREEQEVIAEKVVLDIFNNAAKGELNSILQEANTVKDIPRTVNLIIRNRKYKSLGDFKNFDRGHVPRIFKAALKLGYCSRRGLQYVYLPEGLPEVRPAPAAAEPPAGGVALKPLPLLFTEPFWDQPPDHGEKIHFDKVAGKFDEAEPGYVRAITDEDLEEISGLVNRAGLQDLLRVNFAYSRVKFDEWKDDDPHTRRTLKIESPVEAHSHKVEILLPDLSEKLYDVMQGTFNIAQGASQEELEKIRSHRKISPVKEADYRVKNFLRDQVIEDISGAIWDALYLKMLRGDMRAMAPCLVCTDLAARRYKEPGSGLTQLGTIENDTEASREFFKKMFAAHIDSRNHPEVSPRTGDEIRFIHNVVKFLRSEFKRHGDALFIGSGQAMDSKELMPMMRKEILRFFNNASIDEIEKVLIGMGHKKESRELKKALKKVKTRKASSGYEDFNAIFEDTGFNEDYSTGFIRVLFFEGYFNAERPDEEPPVPVDTEAKSPTEIGGNGEPSDGDPTATTKWLKGLTPEMSAAKRAVFAAPFYEEPIYRFGVPLLVSSLLGVILGTVFTFDLATLPFYIAQAVSAIIFILHHEKGERAPPVIVSLLNGFILPLFSPGMFAFILQSMAIHSIVNLLFMKARSAPEEAEEERGDREEKLKEKARTGPKSLTLDEAVEMSLCYPFNLKIREKAYERLLDFDAQEAISKIVESGLNEDRASRLFACHRAIQHLLKKMPRDEKKKPAGLDLIETKLLDFMDHCLSCPLSKASESKFARFYVWDTLKELMILRDHELKNERRILNIMFVLLASSEKDMMSFYGGSGGSGEPAWAKAQAKFTVFLTFLINLTEGTKFKSLPSEAEKAVTSMLENPAFVEDYEIKLKLLMVLENILRLQNKEQIRKERGVIRGKLRGMPYKTREELSMRQLDNAARVIVELKEYWHEQAGKKDFGDAVEEMAILASGDRRLTAEQKVRFRIGLRNLKTKYLMIKHYARELGQGSPENCDPCELLKTVTGIEVAPDVEFNIRYDEKTPYTVYFEFEKGADYLDFAKKYTNDDSSAGSSEGFYSVEYGICFGFKEDGDSTYRHEVQHAFYDAAG